MPTQFSRIASVTNKFQASNAIHRFFSRPLAPLAIAALLFSVFMYALPASAQIERQPTGAETTAPVADFTVDPPQGVVSTTFFFDAIVSSDAEDNDSWLEVRFDFEDDGTWDTVWLNPTNPAWRHTYTTPNTYTVRLEVKDRDDLTDTHTSVVVVGDPGSNTTPTAVCNVSPSSGPPGTTFTFDANGSTDSQDPSGDLLVKWDKWGTFDFRGQNWQPVTQSVVFSYTTLGLHQVDLLLMDTGNLMDTAECEIEIEPAGGNTAPTAGLAISPTQGTSDTLFNFDLGSSSDNEDKLASLSVRFDWTDDGTFDSGWLNASQSWTYTFADVFGDVTVRAQVRDSGGLTDVVTQTVKIFVQTYMPHLSP